MSSIATVSAVSAYSPRSAARGAQSSSLHSGSVNGAGASGTSTSVSTNADGSTTTTVTNAQGQIVSSTTTAAPNQATLASAFALKADKDELSQLTAASFLNVTA